MKIPHIKVSEALRFLFHGDSHVLPRGDHKVAEVFAKFGAPQDGQPLSGWAEVAAAAAKQHPEKVALYVEYVPDPVPVDPKDTEIAALKAENEALKAAAVPQPDGDDGEDGPVNPGANTFSAA